MPQYQDAPGAVYPPAQGFVGDGMSMGMGGGAVGTERDARPGIFAAFLEADEISRRGSEMGSMNWQGQGQVGGYPPVREGPNGGGGSSLFSLFRPWC